MPALVLNICGAYHYKIVCKKSRPEHLLNSFQSWQSTAFNPVEHHDKTHTAMRRRTSEMALPPSNEKQLSQTSLVLHLHLGGHTQ